MLTLYPPSKAYMPDKIFKSLFSSGDGNKLTEIQNINTRMLWFNSCRSALLFLLLYLGAGDKRRNVVIPSYTCSSVYFAIIAAGFKPIIADVGVEGSLDVSNLKLDSNVIAVISSNPFGIIHDSKKLSVYCQYHGVYFIDDITWVLGDNYANSGYSDFDICSLGYGKVITTAGGGFLRINSNNHYQQLLVKYNKINGMAGTWKNICVLSLYKMLLNKRVYWWLDSAGLGVSDSDSANDLDNRKIDIFKLDGKLINFAFHSIACYLMNHDNCFEINSPLGYDLKPLYRISQSSPKVPFLIESNKSYSQIKSMLRGIGIQPSYGFTNFSKFLDEETNPNGMNLCRRLITLPTESLRQHKQYEYT